MNTLAEKKEEETDKVKWNRIIAHQMLQLVGKGRCALVFEPPIRNVMYAELFPPSLSSSYPNQWILSTIHKAYKHTLYVCGAFVVQMAQFHIFTSSI